MRTMHTPGYAWTRPFATPTVAVYGTGWCAMTMIVRRFLERAGVPYHYVDLERDSRAVRQLAWLTGGSASHPTVVIGGEVLVEPSLRELEWALRRVGVA